MPSNALSCCFPRLRLRCPPVAQASRHPFLLRQQLGPSIAKFVRVRSSMSTFPAGPPSLAAYATSREVFISSYCGLSRLALTRCHRHYARVAYDVSEGRCLLRVPDRPQQADLLPVRLTRYQLHPDTISSRLHYHARVATSLATQGSRSPESRTRRKSASCPAATTSASIVAYLARQGESLPDQLHPS